MSCTFAQIMKSWHQVMIASLLVLVAGNAASSPVLSPGATAASTALDSYQLLTYEATVAGAPAGTATVAMARTDAGYRVAGQARATGLLDALSPWRASFWSAGVFVDGQPRPTEYRYIERGRDKRRDVTVRNGRLSVIKNNKRRPERPALAGHDVLTALFYAPDCSAALDLHTGRHGYRLLADGALEPSAALCSYEVTDEDDDRFGAQLRFGLLDGRRVPTKILVSGALSGSMDLTDSTVVALDCDRAGEGLEAYLCAVGP